MISELTRQILSRCQLKQKDLAEVLGVPIQRVKRLAGGDVSKFTREEGEALIKKLNIRAEWLVTGEGEMFQTPGERELSKRLDTLNDASKQAAEFTDNPDLQQLMQLMLVTKEQIGAEELKGIFDKVLKMHMESRKAVPLNEREMALLFNYRESDEIGKRAVEGTASAVAHRDSEKKAGSQ